MRYGKPTPACPHNEPDRHFRSAGLGSDSAAAGGVVGDTPTISTEGLAATVPKATDGDTVRIETASLITGTALGKILGVIEPGTANGRALHVRAAQVA